MKKKFNKSHLFWIVPLIIILLIMGIVKFNSRLTNEQKEFKIQCEDSGGTFIICSGSQSSSFIGIVKGSCSPAGRLKCYCPEIKGLIEQGGVCIPIN